MARLGEQLSTAVIAARHLPTHLQLSSTSSVIVAVLFCAEAMLPFAFIINMWQGREMLIPVFFFFFSGPGYTIVFSETMSFL